MPTMPDAGKEAQLRLRFRSRRNRRSAHALCVSATQDESGEFPWFHPSPLLCTNSWSVCLLSARNFAGKRRFCSAKFGHKPRKPPGWVVSRTAPLGWVNSLAKYAFSQPNREATLTSSGTRILPRQTRPCASVFQLRSVSQPRVGRPPAVFCQRPHEQFPPVDHENQRRVGKHLAAQLFRFVISVAEEHQPRLAPGSTKRSTLGFLPAHVPAKPLLPRLRPSLWRASQEILS